VFKKLFGRGDKSPRQLNGVSDLQVGDIVSLKHRNELPDPLQGADLEVTNIGTYQYESCNSTEFTLKTAENDVYFLSMEDDDGEQTLCFSIKIKRGDVLSLFDENAFGLLWDEDSFPELTVNPVEHLSPWVAERYYQNTKGAQGYFYNEDCRAKALSEYVSDDDGGEQFQYHECEGNDDRFGVSVEVWSDGTTDVYLQVFTRTDVIEQFHPHGE
jgi:hypothetical protein